MPKCIVFVKCGSFSHVNNAVAAQLRCQFPEFQLVVIDVAHELFSTRRFIYISRLQAYRYYGKDIRSKKRSVAECVLRTPWAINATQAWLRHRLAAYSSDVAFTFQTQSLINAAQEGIPHFLYTDHAHLVNLTYPGFDSGKLYPGFYTTAEQKIYTDARISFVMSRHVEQCLIEVYGCPPHKVSRVLAGTNVSIPAAGPDSDRYRSKRILFNGVDWDRKGGPELIAAFALVLNKHPDARLVIIGCTPRIDIDNVDVIGQVPLADIPQYYAAASIFCMPTKVEPFGIVFVEAMHNALPIIALQIGALPDFVTNNSNGYLVPPGDIQALADAMCLLLDSPLRCREFGQNGLAIARQHYTWDAVGRRIKDKILAEIS